MRLTSKCLAVALSALFAATPAVPAGAMPLPVAKVQPVEAATDVLRVDHRPYVRRHWRGHRHWRHHEGRRWHGHRAYRDWYGGRPSYRHGWYGGRPGYRYGHRRYRHRDNSWVPLAIMGMGAAMMGSAIANDRAYAGGGSHVQWCANRYRSYRAYDNTFQPYNGPRRQCYSPYR
ncbi:BA14K family protein [Shinella sp. BYT-45]|uniref:BA14K family protein n=1 Tax=Shinella sp. BYT-45 TaxID=3377377 RepID=UPI00397EE1FA